jgi:hypothetical protein
MNEREVFMAKFIRIALLAVFAFMTVHATCATAKKKSFKPRESLAFDDEVYYHNMSIAYGDDHHYYTINGGNESYGLVNEYKTSGKFVESYDIEIDGRSIFYHKNDERFYVKVYGTDLYVVDPEEEDAYAELEGIFEEDNSSPGFDPRGRYIYEFVYGTVRVLDFDDGEEIRTIDIDDYYDEFPYNTAIAASEDYLFVWASGSSINVYDLDGNFVSLIQLPRAGYGYSLSYCNDRLWTSLDADGGEEGDTGRWFGYQF